LPTLTVPTDRFAVIEEHARQRVDNGANGTVENHITGALGEFSVACYTGDGHRLDTNLYDDGDGGVDLRVGPATVDVKTVGRGRERPGLTVGAYSELRADYYALAHRVGTTTVRLLGYAPRWFVANAPIREGRNGPYHWVPQHYLFPFPQSVTLD
jgi:hypothetical protein